MRRNGIALVAMLIAACLLSGSCADKAARSVMLEETPVVSGGLGWAVVRLAYVRMLLEPSSVSPDTGTARKGELGHIIARARSFEQRDKGAWYRVEIGPVTGWIHESSLSVFRTEAEARKAVEAGN